MEREGEEPEEDVTIVVMPLSVAAADNGEPQPRRLSIKKIDKMMKRKQTRWFKRHIAPLYDLIEPRVIDTTTLMAYTRLWQLERWLRDLLQLELQGAYGPTWTAHLRAPGRQEHAAKPNAYMSSVDDKNPLAYELLDDLGALLLEQWKLVEYAFPPRARWKGVFETVLALRNRVGHCRRVNSRDLGRLEETLRDLTAGARQTFESYSRHKFIDESYGLLFNHWHRGSATSYQRASWALKSYDTSVWVRGSYRPWAGLPGVRSGELLHVQFRSRTDPIRFEHVIQDLDGIDNIGELIHLNILSPCTVEAVLSRGNDDRVLDELIDTLLELVLCAESRGFKGTMKKCRQASALDYRIHFMDYFANAADMWRADVFRVES
jgi:hypothetical protein